MLDASAIDASFGSGGIAKLPFGTIGYAHDMIVQSNDKIVMVGQYHDGNDAGFGLARLNPNGGPDPLFGGDGKVVTEFGIADDVALGAAILPDGKILAVGFTESFAGVRNVALARYNPDGSLDNSFDSDGKAVVVTPGGPSMAYAVSALANGKFYVAGQASNGVNQDFLVARFNSNGSLDTSFSGDGILTTPIGSLDDRAYNLQVLSNGSILVAGTAFNGTNWDFALAKISTSGNLDTTFGNSGRVVTTLGSTDALEFGFAIQSDGKILLSGSSGGSTARDAVLIRYNANGALDPSFDGDGRVTTAVGAGEEIAYALTVQPNGKILAAGHDNIVNGQSDLLLLRYEPNGVLDSTFSSDGIATTKVGSRNDVALDVSLQRDGRILVAGYTQTSASNSQFLVARYLGDPVSIGGERASQISLDGASVSPFATITSVNPYRETLTLQVVIENGKVRGDFSSASRAGWTRFVDGNDISYTRLVLAVNSGASATSLLRALVFLPRANAIGSEETQFTINITDSAGFVVTNDQVISVINQPVNDPPVLQLAATKTYLLNSGKILLATSGLVSDLDSSNFATGRLIASITSGGNDHNRLEFNNTVALSGNQITQNGVQLGVLNSNGGVGLNNLIVTLNESATPARVQNLLRAITFRTIEESNAGQKVITFSISDGDGATSADRQVVVNTTDVRTENFDIDPGWSAQGSGIDNNSFGYSSTANAGGSSGEVGGQFTRSNTFRYLADSKLTSTLTLDNVIRASGKLDATAMITPDLGQPLFIGHFLTTAAVRGTTNKIGFFFGSENGQLQWNIGVRTSSGGAWLGATYSDFQLNVDRTFEYSWNPNGGAFGFGQLVGTITSATGSETKIVDLPADLRTLGGNFNAFGLNVSYPDPASTGLSNRATIYIDDVSYTASAIPAASARVPVVIDNGQTGYVEAGTWSASSLPGFNSSGTRFSAAGSATATWTPSSIAGGFTAGRYRVEFYKVVNAVSSTNAQLTIKASGSTTTQTINLTTGTSGFVDLGVFTFNGSPDEWIRLSQGIPTGTLRADAVRLTRVS